MSDSRKPDLKDLKIELPSKDRKSIDDKPRISASEDFKSSDGLITKFLKKITPQKKEESLLSIPSPSVSRKSTSTTSESSDFSSPEGSPRSPDSTTESSALSTPSSNSVLQSLLEEDISQFPARFPSEDNDKPNFRESIVSQQLQQPKLTTMEVEKLDLGSAKIESIIADIDALKTEIYTSGQPERGIYIGVLRALNADAVISSDHDDYYNNHLQLQQNLIELKRDLNSVIRFTNNNKAENVHEEKETGENTKAFKLCEKIVDACKKIGIDFGDAWQKKRDEIILNEPSQGHRTTFKP